MLPLHHLFRIDIDRHIRGPLIVVHPALSTVNLFCHTVPVTGSVSLSVDVMSIDQVRAKFHDAAFHDWW